MAVEVPNGTVPPAHPSVSRTWWRLSHKTPPENLDAANKVLQGFILTFTHAACQNSSIQLVNFFCHIYTAVAFLVAIKTIPLGRFPLTSSLLSQ